MVFLSLRHGRGLNYMEWDGMGWDRNGNGDGDGGGDRGGDGGGEGVGIEIEIEIEILFQILGKGRGKVVTMHSDVSSTFFTFKATLQFF
jgi:hypothetical protein